MLWYMKNLLVTYAIIKDPDQPGYSHSLFWAFAVRLESSWIILNTSTDSEAPDKTARKCKLIWTFIAHEGPFLKLRFN